MQNITHEESGVHQLIAVKLFIAAINRVLGVRIKSFEIQADITGIWSIQNLVSGSNCVLFVITHDFPAYYVATVGKWIIDSIELTELEELSVFLVKRGLFFNLLLFFGLHLVISNS